MPATETQTTVTADTSMSDLYAMLDKTPVTAAEPAAEPATPATEAEPAKPAKEEAAEPESGTGKEPQQVEVEEELPEGVKKRIAKEVERTTRAQSAIDRAVSTRKAKEAELAALNGKPGSEPEKHTEPAKDERPKRPDLATYPGTLAEYNAAVAEYETKFEDWITARSRETVSKELSQQQAQEAGRKAWDAAAAEHGAEFPSLMDTLRESTPVEFQTAVSALEDWSRVAVHLAKNEAERNALVEQFKASPVAAIANLGKLEERLKPAAKPAAAEEKPPLPKPLKPVAGGAQGVAPPVDLEKAPMSVFSKEVDRMLSRK